MTQVHTQYGLGEIVAEDIERGRRSYKVAVIGTDTTVWLPEEKVAAYLPPEGGPDFDAPHWHGFAEDELSDVRPHSGWHGDPQGEGGWSEPSWMDDDEEARHYRKPRPRDAEIIAAAPVDFSNSVKLPYNPKVQHPSLPGATESTIQPNHKIDPDKLLHPADSVTFEERTESEGGPWPKPNPALFAASLQRLGAEDEDEDSDEPPEDDGDDDSAPDFGGDDEDSDDESDDESDLGSSDPESDMGDDEGGGEEQGGEDEIPEDYLQHPLIELVQEAQQLLDEHPDWAQRPVGDIIDEQEGGGEEQGPPEGPPEQGGLPPEFGGGGGPGGPPPELGGGEENPFAHTAGWQHDPERGRDEAWGRGGEPSYSRGLERDAPERREYRHHDFDDDDFADRLGHRLGTSHHEARQLIREAGVTREAWGLALRALPMIMKALPAMGAGAAGGKLFGGGDEGGEQAASQEAPRQGGGIMDMLQGLAGGPTGASLIPALGGGGAAGMIGNALKGMIGGGGGGQQDAQQGAQQDYSGYGDSGADYGQSMEGPVQSVTGSGRTGSYSERLAWQAAIGPILRVLGPMLAGGMMGDDDQGGGAQGGGGGSPLGPPASKIDPKNPLPLWRNIDSGGWSGVAPKSASYRPAGLSDKYIEIESSADYHNDPVVQFRHDPDAFISRTGHVQDEGLNPRFAEYVAQVESDSLIREAAWADVRRKALRLRRDGQVHVKDVGPDRIYATVQGDNGVYETMIKKGGSFSGLGGGHGITNWHCGCEWGKWAFKRKYSYVGRLCSHGYAAYLEMQSQHTKGKARLPRQTRPPSRRKKADALQMVPTRLVPEMVVNDTDDTHQVADVTKDERKTTGPDGMVSDRDIKHFTSMLATCERVGAPYPRELVAYLVKRADPATNTDREYEEAENWGDIPGVASNNWNNFLENTFPGQMINDVAHGDVTPGFDVRNPLGFGDEGFWKTPFPNEPGVGGAPGGGGGATPAGEAAHPGEATPAGTPQTPIGEQSKDPDKAGKDTGKYDAATGEWEQNTNTNPINNDLYKAVAGDTATDMLNRAYGPEGFEKHQDEFMKANDISDINDVYVGQEYKMPGASTTDSKTGNPTPTDVAGTHTQAGTPMNEPGGAGDAAANRAADNADVGGQPVVPPTSGITPSTATSADIAADNADDTLDTGRRTGSRKLEAYFSRYYGQPVRLADNRQEATGHQKLNAYFRRYFQGAPVATEEETDNAEIDGSPPEGTPGETVINNAEPGPATPAGATPSSEVPGVNSLGTPTSDVAGTTEADAKDAETAKTDEEKEQDEQTDAGSRDITDQTNQQDVGQVGGGDGGMDMGAMTDMMGGLTDAIGPAIGAGTAAIPAITDLASSIPGMISGLMGGFLGSKQEMFGYKLAAEDGFGYPRWQDHEPFNGSGPVGPLVIHPSAEHMDGIEYVDVTDLDDYDIHQRHAAARWFEADDNATAAGTGGAGAADTGQPGGGARVPADNTFAPTPGTSPAPQPGAPATPAAGVAQPGVQAAGSAAQPVVASRHYAEDDDSEWGTCSRCGYDGGRHSEDCPRNKETRGRESRRHYAEETDGPEDWEIGPASEAVPELNKLRDWAEDSQEEFYQEMDQHVDEVQDAVEEAHEHGVDASALVASVGPGSGGGGGGHASYGGGIKRAGKPRQRPPVEPTLVRVYGGNGQGGTKTVAHFDDSDPYSKTAADFGGDEPEPVTAGVDVVAQFQRSAAAAGLMAESGGGGGGDDFDIAAAAKAHLKTAGRNYSLSEQHELMNERHPQGARNLASLDLEGTHYEAENSVGLW